MTVRSLTDRVRTVLRGYVSTISAESVLKGALRRTGRTRAELERDGLDDALIAELVRGLAFFVPGESERRRSQQELGALKRPGSEAPAPLDTEVEIPIEDESGIVDARTRARAFARALGFDRAHQARIATSVSELARNIYAYARPGCITLCAVEIPRVGIRIVARDRGPGIPNLDEILEGSYRSRTGMGLGILACRRLMDEFSITSEPGRGTTVTLAKYVP